MKNGDNKNEASPMDLGNDSNKTDENKTESKTREKSRGYYYNPLCTTPVSQARPTITNTSRHIHITTECYRLIRKESQ